MALTFPSSPRRGGSLATGKDGDIALFDGDPLECTSQS